MVIYPNAKINLGLQVTGKRADGYHNIDSVFYPVGWKDVLEIIHLKKERKSWFTCSGIPIPGLLKNNLCVKAFELLKKEYGIGEIKLHLHKQIPMGAGLGGGSADGAFALTLLNRVFSLNLSDEVLKTLAGKLGSDCIFFIENKPAHITGRGEVTEPVEVNLDKYSFVIVYPGLHISTEEAYGSIEVKSPPHTTKEIVTSVKIEEWKNSLLNGFERWAINKYPVIGEVKKTLYKSGAIYASMTGSGSAVYGIFEKVNEEDIKSKFGNLTVKVLLP